MKLSWKHIGVVHSHTKGRKQLIRGLKQKSIIDVVIAAHCYVGENVLSGWINSQCQK